MWLSPPEQSDVPQGGEGGLDLARILPMEFAGSCSSDLLSHRWWIGCPEALRPAQQLSKSAKGLLEELH